MPYNLLLVCAALGLRLEQAVPVRKRTWDTPVPLTDVAGWRKKGNV